MKKTKSKSEYIDIEIDIMSNLNGTSRVVFKANKRNGWVDIFFPWSEKDIENKLSKLDHTTDIQAWGEELFNTLFQKVVRDLYYISRSEAHDQGKKLRIILNIEPSSAAALPWELMYDSSDGKGEYICFSGESAQIIRYIPQPKAAKPLRINLPLRILVMAATPSGRVSLSAEEEITLMKKAVSKLEQYGLVQLEIVSGQSWEKLQDYVTHGTWHVFHFIGHGGFDEPEGYITLSNDKGEGDPFYATPLARTLVSRDHPQLVVLSSCYGARSSTNTIFSSTASVLISHGIPAVVAMQHRISDKVAAAMMGKFYEELAREGRVDSAMGQARLAMMNIAATNKQNHVPEWWVPVLYMQSEDGMLFRVSGSIAADNISDNLTSLVEQPFSTVTPEIQEAAASMQQEQEFAFYQNRTSDQPINIQFKLSSYEVFGNKYGPSFRMKFIGSDSKDVFI